MTKGASFKAEAPVALFQTQRRRQPISSFAVFSYDVSGDGQRFLIITKVDRSQCRAALRLSKLGFGDGEIGIVRASSSVVRRPSRRIWCRAPGGGKSFPSVSFLKVGGGPLGLAETTWTISSVGSTGRCDTI